MYYEYEFSRELLLRRVVVSLDHSFSPFSWKKFFFLCPINSAKTYTTKGREYKERENICLTNNVYVSCCCRISPLTFHTLLLCLSVCDSVSFRFFCSCHSLVDCDHSNESNTAAGLPSVDYYFFLSKNPSLSPFPPIYSCVLLSSVHSIPPPPL